MVVSPPRIPGANLPVDLTSFVGRRHELAEVKRLLSIARLVTLTGVGGVGKTRLALKTAADVRRAFPDGVWFVDLAELHDPALLAHTVAAALGIREQSARWQLGALSEYLASRQLLLVLDNCEHLVDACAVLADTLLRACPELRILATSRQPLGIGGETTLTVASLTLPDVDAPLSLRTLAQYEAVSLFAERAAAALPEFRLTEDNQVAVAGICRALDGIPLAIELAAVRLRALSVGQILERLTDRYRLLTGGSRSAPDRQQTLRASIEWSFELCSPEERVLWARLSVFSGGFALDAAEGICSGEGLPPEVILDLVASLVDKSILIREEHGSRVRYRLLETIREYGQDRLRQADEHMLLRRRHRHWYSDLITRARADWLSSRQVEWLARLGQEHANMQTALEFCFTEPDEAVAGLRIATALQNYWITRGLLGEGRHWLDRALERETAPTAERVDALSLDSILTLLQGDTEAASQMVAEGREIAQRLDDTLALAFVTLAAGFAAAAAFDLPGALVYAQEALAAFRAAGDLDREVETLVVLALAYSLLGDEDRAVACHQECLAITEPRGESWHRSTSLCALGMAAWKQGDIRRALALTQESLRLKRTLDDQTGISACLEILAWIEADNGHGERAAVLLGAAAAGWQTVGAAVITVSPDVFRYHQGCEERIRAAIGEKAFQAALRKGQGLTSEEALGYALDEKADAAPQAPKSAGPALTRREQEIAELIAQGLGNREIASTLVIAQRTAEGHVERILSKLGFTSRAQVAAWVVERRGQDEPEPDSGRRPA